MDPYEVKSKTITPLKVSGLVDESERMKTERLKNLDVSMWFPCFKVLATDRNPGIEYEYWLPPDQYALHHGRRSPLRQAHHTASYFPWEQPTTTTTTTQPPPATTRPLWCKPLLISLMQSWKVQLLKYFLYFEYHFKVTCIIHPIADPNRWFPAPLGFPLTPRHITHVHKQIQRIVL